MDYHKLYEKPGEIASLRSQNQEHPLTKRITINIKNNIIHATFYYKYWSLLNSRLYTYPAA